MKAFFLTTHTHDVVSLIRAWDCWNEIPCIHFTFDYSKEPIDDEIIQAVKKYDPDIIFYIGACGPTRGGPFNRRAAHTAWGDSGVRGWGQRC
mgnify:CR=1 FL=1